MQAKVACRVIRGPRHHALTARLSGPVQPNPPSRVPSCIRVLIVPLRAVLLHTVLCPLGTVLCRLVNTAVPGTVPEKKINQSTMPFKQMVRGGLAASSARTIVTAVTILATARKDWPHPPPFAFGAAPRPKTEAFVGVAVACCNV